MEYRRDRIDAAAIRKRLGQAYWDEPEPLGEDGWVFFNSRNRRIIVTFDPDSEPGAEWVHASIGHADPARLPSYGELKQMHQAIWPDGHAYQCFVPLGEHINIKSNVLHLWGRLDGKPCLPDFGKYGTI